MAMRRQFGDVPPLVSHVGIQLNGQSVQFPEGTIELLASDYPSLRRFAVQAVYVLPETQQWHLIRYQAELDRHHGTILTRLYNTDDQRQELVEAVNKILLAQRQTERVPSWAK